MPMITTKDNTQIYYKDWGQGDAIVFSHGWPLSADAWDAQMLFLGEHGYRVIAHDRRGHGRSSQPWDGHNMDTYADDLASLLEQLNLTNVTLVGHSAGGGEIVRYIRRHGESRLKKIVLIGAVPPLMLKTPANPDGLEMDVFDDMRDQLRKNRPQFYQDFSLSFFNYDKFLAEKSQGVLDSFWMQGMMGSIKAQYDGIRAFSETDFTEDLKKITVPTLFLHGDDDQTVPIKDSAERASKLVKNSILEAYSGASHGMCVTHAEQVNADLLAFIKSNKVSPKI
ncbi:MAG: alpha/beta fold hydrolase [Janthinobacterium lividum]